MSVFETLNRINVNEHTEKKNGLTYLSWAWAWSEIKKNYPDACYTVYENNVGWNYFTDGKTCWVKTGVIINGLEHIEYLPVMDYKNKSIPIENVTSFDVNKAIQRSLTKACARHGLGLYIYAGEDLPEESKEKNREESTSVEQEERPVKYICLTCHKEVQPVTNSQGKLVTAEEVYKRCSHKCYDCYKKEKELAHG